MLMKVLVFSLMSQVGIASFYLVNLFFLGGFFVSKKTLQVQELLLTAMNCRFPSVALVKYSKVPGNQWMA